MILLLDAVIHRMTASTTRPEGVTDHEWREFLKAEETFNKALLARICPDCAGPVTKTFDRRQRPVPGMWFSYQCQSKDCGFMLEQREAN
jgi:hypothetical protein